MDAAIPTTKQEKTHIEKDAGRLADFVMFSQRSFLLNLTKELNRANVSHSQLFLLGYLAKEDYLTTTDIAKKMGHSTAAATGLVDRLVKLGYVQRLHASDDRRKVMVQITRKGIDLVDKMRENIVEDFVEVMADMDRGDAETVLEALEHPITRNENDLVSAVNCGPPKEFWGEFQSLSDRLETGDISAEENARLVEMADQVEQADAQRLTAAAELAKLRGMTLEEIVGEYQISGAARE